MRYSCVPACVCPCVWIGLIYTYIYAYIQPQYKIHAFLRGYKHTYIYTPTYASIFTCKHTCIHTNKHTYMHTSKPTYLHIYIRSYIHYTMYMYHLRSLRHKFKTQSLTLLSPNAYPSTLFFIFWSAYFIIFKICFAVQRIARNTQRVHT